MFDLITKHPYCFAALWVVVSVTGFTVLASLADWLIGRAIGSEPAPRAEDVLCPTCGYYCLGKGGWGCIDKPGLVKIKTKGGANE